MSLGMRRNMGAIVTALVTAGTVACRREVSEPGVPAQLRVLPESVPSFSSTGESPVFDAYVASAAGGALDPASVRESLND